MSSIYSQDLVPLRNKEYKLFLVEVDDEDRERVLSARVRGTEIIVNPEYENVCGGVYDTVISTYKVGEVVRATFELVPSKNGTYFEIVDFSNEEE